MALERSHWRFVVRDQYGYAIQNAKVNVFQPGTSNAFTGSAFTADTGGSGVTNPLTTNATGEVEAWFDTPQKIDIQVDDNTDTAYRAVNGASATISFTTFTERGEIYRTGTDLPTEVGTSSDIVDIDPGDTTAAGSTGRWADAGHQHENTALPNAHSDASHTDVTRKIWLPVHDGVVLDGGTLTTTGTPPAAVRTVSLADAATSGVAWTFVWDDFTTGNVSAEVYWAGSTTNANSVRWQFTSQSRAEGADITTAGTAVAFTSQAVSTANFLIIDAVTSLTVSTNNGELFRIALRRLGTDGADAYTGAALLIGVLLSYTAAK